jgi:hypothetical protein
VARYQGKVSRIYFRADAAFAMPEVYEFLEAERDQIRDPATGQPGFAEQHRLSAQSTSSQPLSAVHVAGTQSTAFEVAKLVAVPRLL